MATALLSKSRFQYGRQCLKRLYLEAYHRELADPVGAGLQAIFDSGTAVGELARRRFPNGRLVQETYLEHAQAVETTKALLADDGIPALYEAAFTFQGIRTRIDVLRRNGWQGFDLVEAKSTTSVKPEHVTDVAIQVYAAEGCGVRIDRAYLMYINKAYVYQGGDHDLEQLFTLEDVSDRARAFVAESVPNDLDRMWEALQLDHAPDIAVGLHCTSPHRCSFYGHCHQDEPEQPITDLPRLKRGDYERLKASGIREIGGIPPDFPGAAETAWLAARASRLGEIAFPAAFLDFETVGPAVPVYVVTRPYQRVPFQWSMHVLDAGRRLSHASFLNGDAEDPRERFITGLLEAVPIEGSIVAYSPYEKTMMRELAEGFPHHKDGLLALCDRVVDLLKLVRGGYYHPGFNGSYSLKSVLPALVPDMDYADLDVQDGMAASMAYARMTAADAPASEKASIRQALLAYCERDTEAMVRIYNKLLSEAGGGGP